MQPSEEISRRVTSPGKCRVTVFLYVRCFHTLGQPLYTPQSPQVTVCAVLSHPTHPPPTPPAPLVRSHPNRPQPPTPFGA